LEKPEEKRLFGKPECSWKDTIKVELEAMK
jgi:hypothetical protein